MYELSPEIEIRWMGMRSDSRTMQRCGWEFAVNRSIQQFDDRLDVIASHKDCGMRLYGSIPADLLMRSHYSGAFVGASIRLNGMQFFSEKAHVALPVANYSPFDFMRVDMAPSITEKPARNPFDVFTPWAPDAEEIIVDPPTVAGLLEQIRSLQEPELAEIRKRNRAREYRQGDQREVVRAQILTFAA